MSWQTLKKQFTHGKSYFLCVPELSEATKIKYPLCQKASLPNNYRLQR